MIDQRNIEIESGDLSIGANNLFEDLKEAQKVYLYVQSVGGLELSKGNEAQLKLELSASDFDQLAIEWCKKRKLQGAFGGPVGQEWGSPDCEWE